jgi:acyl-CoA synthetase (AMP-forming)/AMP-acid ligase II
VRVLDGPITAMQQDLLVPAGEVGEVVVRSGVVSPAYFHRPDADRLAKIPDEDGAWHRMGDLGRLDDEGRLWFCGRKADRIEAKEGALYTTCVEPAFEAHPEVARAAVVGVGARPRQRPVLVVEPAAGRFPRTASARADLTEALRVLGDLHAKKTGSVPVRDVLFHRALPLDVRHNAKILRHELVAWAARRVG